MCLICTVHSYESASVEHHLVTWHESQWKEILKMFLFVHDGAAWSELRWNDRDQQNQCGSLCAQLTVNQTHVSLSPSALTSPDKKTKKTKNTHRTKRRSSEVSGRSLWLQIEAEANVKSLMFYFISELNDTYHLDTVAQFFFHILFV